MHLAHVYDPYPPGHPEAEYLAEVVRRLRSILGGDLGEDEGVALIEIINGTTITLDDGFVINDEGRLALPLGYVEGEMICAALVGDPERTPDWWRQIRHGRSPSSTSAIEERVRLRDRLAEHGAVIEVW